MRHNPRMRNQRWVRHDKTEKEPAEVPEDWDENFGYGHNRFPFDHNMRLSSRYPHVYLFSKRRFRRPPCHKSQLVRCERERKNRERERHELFIKHRIIECCCCRECDSARRLRRR